MSNSYLAYVRYFRRELIANYLFAGFRNVRFISYFVKRSENMLGLS
jgi:hypothetical protein